MPVDRKFLCRSFSVFPPTANLLGFFVVVAVVASACVFFVQLVDAVPACPFMSVERSGRGESTLEVNYSRFLVNVFVVAYRPLTSFAHIAQGELQLVAEAVGCSLDRLRDLAAELSPDLVR